MNRFPLFFPLASLLLLSVLSQVGFAQTPSSSQAPAQDPQPLALLQQSVKAMGGIVPSDSVATGTVTIVAGSQTSQGTIRILTRGTAQSLVQLTTSSETQTVIFSNGQANEITGGAVNILPLEPTVSIQAPEFPIVLFAALLNDPNTSFQYVGAETLNAQSLQHLRSWNSFASQPDLQSLASFSMRDIWIDAASGLPERVSYIRRPAQGAVAGVAIDIYFSNYQNTGGTLYPRTIEKSMNGTPWATIAIQNVSFNTGLTDASFAVQ